MSAVCVAVVLGDVVEHEPAAFAVAEHAALAAHALGDEQAPYARRPHHARRVELDELHVLQRRAGVVGKRLPVGRVFPAVAGDAERAAHAAGGEHDGLRLEQAEPAAFAVVAERPDHAAAVLQQREDREFRVHVDSHLDRVILQGPDHLQSGTVTDVRKARIPVAAEIALEDPAVARTVEHGAPRLEFAHAIRRLLCMKLRHAPVVHVLPAAHRVGKVHAPIVAVVDIAERGRHAALRHHGVRFPQQRLRHDTDGSTTRCGADRGAQAGTARANDEDIVLERLVLRHQKSLQSVQTPIEHRRM